MDSVLDVVRKEAEGTDCLQGLFSSFPALAGFFNLDSSIRLPNYTLTWWWYWGWYGYPPHLQDQRGLPRQNDVHILRRAQPKGF